MRYIKNEGTINPLVLCLITFKKLCKMVKVVQYFHELISLFTLKIYSNCTSKTSFLVLHRIQTHTIIKCKFFLIFD